MEDRLNIIFEGLKQKSTTKQTIYRNTCRTFQRLKEISQDIVAQLSSRISDVDKNVVIEYRNINDFEFHIKFSGDLLVCVMHSNVITLPDSYEFMNSPYVEADYRRRFFGHIMAYNFMADSVKYHRMNDPGYLIGRLLVNYENHFLLESVQQLDLDWDDMSKNEITDEALRLMVESAMVACVNNDLMGQELDEIKKITVKEKLENQQISRAQKMGFQFGHHL